MTAAAVMSITDELIAELNEQLCGPEFYMVEMPMGHMRALLAERAELKRDAERYKWLRDQHNNTSATYSVAEVLHGDWVSIEENNGITGTDLDAAIDAAML